MTLEETIEQALMEHRVITDGLAAGTGWCEACGTVSDDQEAHQASVVAGVVKATFTTLFEAAAEAGIRIRGFLNGEEAQP